MMQDGLGIVTVADAELQRVRGGKSFWDRVKRAAKWVKDHVVIGLDKIGLKGTF